MLYHDLDTALAVDAARREAATTTQHTQSRGRLRAAVAATLVAAGTRLMPPTPEPPRRASPATPC